MRTSAPWQTPTRSSKRPRWSKRIRTKAASLHLCRLTQAAAAGSQLNDETPTDRAALSRVTKLVSNDGKTILSDEFMRQLLLDSARYGFVISTHCQPERATVARDIALLREVGGNLHVGHISRAETVDMIRAAKAEGLPITCEVTPHHLIGFDSDYKVNPPLRTKRDTLALIEGILDGTIDCLSPPTTRRIPTRTRRMAQRASPTLNTPCRCS
jgi:dihydroorotase